MNFRFTHNVAANGGAIYNLGNSISISNSTFEHNIANGVSLGGAIYTTGSCNIHNCRVANNSAYVGGGIYGASAAVVTVVESTVNGNNAHIGGGIYSVYDGI